MVRARKRPREFEVQSLGYTYGPNTGGEVRIDTGIMLVACVFVFGKAYDGIVHEPDCIPQPVHPASWDGPFGVSVADTIVEYHPNEYMGSRRAIQVAYDNPQKQVRLVSIQTMKFRLKDGTPCTYRPETDDETISRSTRSAGVPGIPASAGVRR